jgi:hypothetical protein
MLSRIMSRSELRRYGGGRRRALSSLLVQGQGQGQAKEEMTIPTELDAQELFLRMNARSGSLITEEGKLPKYNLDWTVRSAV